MVQTRIEGVEAEGETTRHLVGQIKGFGERVTSRKEKAHS